MIEGARYAHTNLIARDWRKLAAFYIEHFGCSIVQGNIIELQSWQPAP
jgi:predicted enzyme related to lactoylglutathione lyase